MAYNKKLSSLEWDNLINDYRTGGKTGAVWCKEHGLKEHQLRFQINKRNKQKPVTKSTTPAFVPLEVIRNTKNDKTADAGISIILGQMEICVKQSFDQNVLADVIKTLQSLC